MLYIKNQGGVENYNIYMYRCIAKARQANNNLCVSKFD